MMRTIGFVGLFVGLAAVAAPRVAAAKGVTPPPELIATIARGDSTSLDGLRGFFDAMKPGVGAMLNDQMIDMGVANVTGVAPLDGLDHNAGMYLLYVDGGGTRGWAVVGKVGDAKRLPSGGSTAVVTQGGWAVLGTGAVIKKVQAYAFAALAPAATPTAPTITLYSAAALARYHSQIEVMRKLMTAQLQAQGNGMSSMMEGYIDGMLSVAADSDRAVLTIDADKTNLAFDLSLVPVKGSKLARFIAAQKPSDYGMLAQLPASSPMIVLAGHFDAGPYHQGVLDVMSSMYGAGGAKYLVATIAAVMKASNGDVAFTMDMGGSAGMTAAYLIGTSDPKAVDAAFAKLIDALGKARTVDIAGTEATIKAAAPGQHDGVTVRAYDTTYDLAKLDPVKRKAMERMLGGSDVSRAAMAAFDKLAVFAIAGSADPIAAAGVDIDTARGKGAHYAPTKDVERILAASRARKDSAVMLIDFATFGALMPQPTKLTGTMVMTTGFADGAAHLRLSMPIATFQAAARQKQP